MKHLFAITLYLLSLCAHAADYSVPLPAQCTVGGKSVLTGTCDSVTPAPPPGTFLVIPNSAGGYFTHWAGTYQLDFCNGGCTSPLPIDVAKFDQIFKPWPGQAGQVVYTKLPVNKYFSAQFTVPVGKLQPGNYGGYRSGETNNQANYSITISTVGGDFSNPSQAGSTVLPGCWKNNLMTKGVLQWNALATPTNPCVLQNGKTYFLNFVNANIAGALPNGGGSMTNTKRDTCTAGTYCVLPIYNGPRNFP